MRKHRGIFITFEKTIDGLGGSTQCALLYAKLMEAGVQKENLVITREPGGTPIGQRLRDIILDATVELSGATVLFLFMADRAQHYKEILKPSLKKGKIVISDRYLDSTLAYQGSGAGWKTAFLLRLHQATTGMLIPDLTFVLDGVPHGKLNTQDRFEQQGSKFYEKVRRGMLYFASTDERYVLIDANRPVEIIADQVLAIVKERFPSIWGDSTSSEVL